MRTKPLSILILIFTFGCNNYAVEDIQSPNALNCKSPEFETPNYYWFEGNKIPIYQNSDLSYVLIKTDEVNNFEACINRNRSLVKSKRLIDYTMMRIDSLPDSNNNVEYTSLTVKNLAYSEVNMDDIVYSSPYFKTLDGADFCITNKFCVQVSSHEELKRLKQVAQDYNVDIIGQNVFDPSIYELSCNKHSKGSTLEISNTIYELGLFQFVSPEFVVESMPSAAPNDLYFTDQWNLYNSDTGIHINYLNAISTTSFPHLNDVIVAVVDNGIYSHHEDLSLYNVSYDAHRGTSPSGLYGDHGTCVAGVIGAASNNSKGIAGIASGVKIMPISICYSKDAEKLGIEPSSTSQLANAIRFAANNGARIINNSWGFNTTSPIPEINNAIEYAHKKGCIVVFAAGNSHGQVLQPAANAPIATLVVGAINKTGYKADFSCYGSSVDIVAPGVDIVTTNSSGSYSVVSGTSFSAPHVSAIAALIFGINPNIQPWRVRDILEQSVSKVGGNAFDYEETRLNGTWNQFVGYGLIDASKAVSAVSGPEPLAPTINTTLNEANIDDLLEEEIDFDEAWDKIYIAKGRGSITVSIDNYDSSSAYIWNSSLYPYSGDGTTFTVDYASNDKPVLHEITCKALKNGLSVTSGISILVVPKNYSF